MSRFQIKKAVRKGQKARVALSSPSGGGKTWTALEIATVLAGDGQVLVVDTERGEASLYADDFEFDTIEWTPPFSPWELAQVIRDVPSDPYAVVVVDSLSHFWKGPGGTLAIVDENAPKGNSYVGWKVGGEAQDEMVSALTSAEFHVIATMRSKTEYVLETNDKGKQVPRKVGMAPVQRDDLEYEFTVTGELDKTHTLRIDKSRCSALADRVFPAGKASEMAAMLSDWLESAEPLATVKQRRELQDRLNALDRDDRKALRPRWKAAGFDLERLLASEVETASALIAEYETTERPTNGRKPQQVVAPETGEMVPVERPPDGPPLRREDLTPVPIPEGDEPF
jgi:hypothetical protein